MKWKPKPTQENPVVPEFVSEEYFSIQSLKRAVWQYLIDHSHITDDEGTVNIHFYIPHEFEFWRRVKARDDGKFKRKEMYDFQQTLRNQHKKVQELRRIKNQYYDLISQIRLNEYHEKRYQDDLKRLLEKGSFYQKTLLFIAKITASISHKIHDKVIHKPVANIIQ